MWVKGLKYPRFYFKQKLKNLTFANIRSLKIVTLLWLQKMII